MTHDNENPLLPCQVQSVYLMV